MSGLEHLKLLFAVQGCNEAFSLIGRNLHRLVILLGLYILFLGLVLLDTMASSIFILLVVDYILARFHHLEFLALWISYWLFLFLTTHKTMVLVCISQRRYNRHSTYLLRLSIQWLLKVILVLDTKLWQPHE